METANRGGRFTLRSLLLVLVSATLVAGVVVAATVGLAATSGSCPPQMGSGSPSASPVACVMVAAVRYAPLQGDYDNGTPGLPVIKDDESTLEYDRAYDPFSCPGLPGTFDYDWVNCTGTGTTDKNWPVVYPEGHTLNVNAVRLYSQSRLQDPELTATASIGGETLNLSSTSLSSTPVSGGQFLLSAGDLGFSGNLPDTPGVDQLVISWTVTSDGNPDSAGDSSTPVYVTAAPYVQPENEAIVPPYISVLDVGTRAAAGQTSPEDVFDAIWEKFGSLKIAHPILDPEIGQITSGPQLEYYENGYTTIGDWWNKPFGSCPALTGFLATDSGHCGNWAQFLAGVLGWQGIQATYLGLRTGESITPNFYPGPEPAPRDPAAAYAYMLIDPQLWHFATANASGPYPYADTLSVSKGQVTVGTQAFTYTPSGSPISQGGVSTPPEMFRTGDHAIVFSSGGYEDPSYGLPPAVSPYPAIEPDYEDAAIAGFAVIYYRVTFSPFFSVWLPLRNTENPIFACAFDPCQFRAVPYAESGAP